MGISYVSSRTFCFSLSGQKWKYLVHNRVGLGPRTKPWQRHNGCHFFSYLAYIIGAKFDHHHYNISRDILDFVIYLCTEMI